MTYGSVCSGIEAATVAWQPLDWQCAFVSEIDKFPCAVLDHHNPAVPNRGDMTKFKGWPDESINVLVGGTPCQSFSVAGLRKGLDDPRGNLTLTYLAIAAKYRPQWLVWENVPGVLSDRTRAFGAFLWGLGELGYGFAYRILDAQYFRVPQRRRRVFVVGCLGSWQRAAAVLFERYSLQGHIAPSRETRERIAPTISARTKGGCGLGTDFDCDGGLIAGTMGAHSSSGRSYGSNPIPGNLITHAPDIARCIATREGTSQDYETTTMVAHSLRAEGFDASEDGTGRGTPIVPTYTLAIRGRGDSHDLEYRTDGTANAILTPNGGRGGIGVGAIAFDTTQITSPANVSSPKPGDPCHPLAAGAHAPTIAFDCKASGQNGFGVGEIASTMRSMGHTQSHQNGGGHQAAMVDMQVRRLTPRECERLQGFPDDYTLIPYNGKPAKDGPRYKALGNSMAVPVMAWIGERIAGVTQIAEAA